MAEDWAFQEAMQALRHDWSREQADDLIDEIRARVIE